MEPTARSIAENASFHAFINGYFREIDGGEWQDRDSWCAQTEFPFTLSGNEVVELYLPFAHLRVLFDVSYRSKVGRHHFHRVFVCEHSVNKTNSTNWKPADLVYLMISLVREIYQKQSPKGELVEAIKKNETELLGRLIDSFQQMTLFLDARSNDAALSSLDFIDTEQAILYGHWLHPTPKSRQGIAFWQQSHYSPELAGKFKLHYFSVAKTLVMQGSTFSKATSEVLFEEVAKYDSIDLLPDHVLIPVHPLQVQQLLLEGWVRELLANGSMIYLGEKGAEYTATSSVRTVFNEDSEWMYKLSIPVKITNSLRTNKRRELKDGMVVEKYLQETGFLNERPYFKVIDDPAYITVNHPVNSEMDSGFEVVLRRNLFVQEKGQGICSVLTLAQDPIPSLDHPQGISLLKKIILDLAIKENRNVQDVAMDWFLDYWRCAVESLIVLYDRYGIALEAHQQNSLLDVSTGYPSCYYYRDNQGFYLSKHYRESLAEVDAQLNLSDINYSDDKIFTAISYYIFVNQLFAIIYRLGADNLIEEDVLVARCQLLLQNLQKQMRGMGKSFIDYILNSDRLDFKTNLLARVNDIDELQEGMEHAVYSTIENPLYVVVKPESRLSEDCKESFNVAYA